MAAQGLTGPGDQDGARDDLLFSGITFWVSAGVPAKQTLVEKITANGGAICVRESDATVKIADHLRVKYRVPGSFSYTFIEESVRRGQLADLDTHRIGDLEPGPRPAGATTQPAKGSRQGFTAEDDKLLLEWVRRHVSASGKTFASGNVIYKQLEEINPRHTWQSWRDRYVRRFKRPDFSDVAAPPDLPAGGAMATGPTASELQRGNAVGAIGADGTGIMDQLMQASQDESRDSPPPSTRQNQPQDRPETHAHQSPSQQQVPLNLSMFDDDDYRILFNGGKDIYGVDPQQYDAAWLALAIALGGHTAEEWKFLWEHKVRYDYHVLREQRLRDGQASEEESGTDEDESSEEAAGTDEAEEEDDAFGEAESGQNESVAEEDAEQRASELLPMHNPEGDASTEPAQRPRKRKHMQETTITRPESQPLDDDEAGFAPPKRTRLSEDLDEAASNSGLSDDEAQFFTVADTTNAASPGNPVDLTQLSDRESPESDEYLSLEDTGPAESQVITQGGSQPKQHVQFDLPRPDGESGSPGDEQGSPAASDKPRQAFNPAALRNLSPALPSDSQTSILNNLLGGPSQPTPDSSRRDHPQKERDIPAAESADQYAREFAAWVEEHRDIGVGQETIDQALMATSGNIWIADTVIRSLQVGLGVPKRIRGIWTDGDDQELLAGRSRQSLVRKHGEAALEDRREFLQAHEDES